MGGRTVARRTVRWVMVPGVLASTCLVAIASTVFACTLYMGNLVLTPSSGPAGTTVSTTVTNLKPYPAQYDLFFGGQCMSFTGKLLKTITTNAHGGWTNVKVHIPLKSKPGTYALCGVEAYPSAGQTATSHDTFTVV